MQPDKFYDARVNEAQIERLEREGKLEKFIANIGSAYIGIDHLTHINGLHLTVIYNRSPQEFALSMDHDMTLFMGTMNANSDSSLPGREVIAYLYYRSRVMAISPYDPNKDKDVKDHRITTIRRIAEAPVKNR